MNHAYFNSTDPPSEDVLTEIKNRDHFIVVLTPASIRRGFHLSGQRLITEVAHANETQCRITIICAYDLIPERIRQRSSFGDSEDTKTVQISDLTQKDAIKQLLLALDFNLSSEVAIPDISELQKTQLRAEVELDRGLTEAYDAYVDNYKSNALVYYDEAINIDPNYADAYYRRAKNRHPTNFYENALENFARAIELNSTEARFYAGRGEIYERQQMYSLAVSDYTSAIQYAPNEHKYYKIRATLYKHYDRLDEALADYTSAIQLKPDAAYYYVDRSLIYGKQKKYHSAIKDITQAIDLHSYNRYKSSGHWRNYIVRGFLYFDIGQPDKTEKDWKQALEIAQEKDAVYLFMSGIYRVREEFEEALEMAHKALEINPDNLRAQGTIKQIKRLS